MQEIIKYKDLGMRDFGWLQARHHFSFGDYYDPKRMGIGPLRVWNDDIIASETGFPSHPHRNMNIVTYVRQGAISHEDSMGHKGRTGAGDIQVMVAGSGIYHSEFNLESEPTRLFQIWFLPRHEGGKPWWDQREFPKQSTGHFKTIATGFKQELSDKDVIFIESDISLKAGKFKKGSMLQLPSIPDMARYLVVDFGQFSFANGDKNLQSGDALYLSPMETIEITFLEDSNLVMAELLLPA